MVPFQFSSHQEHYRVHQGAHWHFDNSLVLIEEVNRDALPQKFSLTKIFFWIQVHNILLFYMRKEVDFSIGESWGDVLKVNFDENGMCWGMRVKIHILKPLTKGMKLQLENGGCTWVDFQFKWLHDFCFICGLLGHVQCLVCDDSVKQYGHWLYVGDRDFADFQCLPRGGKNESSHFNFSETL